MSHSGKIMLGPGQEKRPNVLSHPPGPHLFVTGSKFDSVSEPTLLQVRKGCEALSACMTQGVCVCCR